jgi:hypothetical protein
VGRFHRREFAFGDERALKILDREIGKGKKGERLEGGGGSLGDKGEKKKCRC